MTKRKLIIDCDPGVDDAIALAFATAHQEAFEILGITTVSGNLGIDVVTQNALDLTGFYGLDVPVCQGMNGPMVREAVFAEKFHGETGLGYCVLPGSGRHAEEMHAVTFMRKTLMELPENEKLTIVALGPMTNLGVLLRFYPEVKEKIQEIVFMGGAACGGNVTPSAEFNIYVDPEAARIVFRSGIPLVMCGLDVTVDCGLSSTQIMKLCQSEDAIAKACGDMTGYTLENTNCKYRGMVSVHDAVPFMYLLYPEMFKREKAILDVDCSEGESLGRTICDMRWWDKDPEEMHCLVLTGADKKKFQEQLITGLFQLGAEVDRAKNKRTEA